MNTRKDLVIFFTVAFTTTYAFWLSAIALGGAPTSFPTAVPFLLGGFGPVIGAIVIRVLRARRGEPVPAHSVRTWSGARLLWVPLLLVLAPATVVGGALLANLLGGPELSLAEGQKLIASVGGLVPFLLSMIVTGPLAEEPGWRGTAHPRLRASLGRVGSGLVLGVAWAIWHLPLFFISGTVQNELGLFSWSGLLFSLSVVPMALLTGWAYERAGVIAAIATHFGVNATMALLTVSSPVTQAVVLVVQMIVVTVLLAATPRTRTVEPVLTLSPR
ncbi:CPBP family intramembrane glutamic endopeptidase [Herbidospora mongoliensis]|uniref:CPBP family intramembrane glutamic endopeptidase n=1 Tax=Herbidospora mongoliensis TaxID=688067 RepID=UPI00082BEE40|nr:type II CAAX endopeptidase family protein [Herbidospora mongoliensis]